MSEHTRKDKIRNWNSKSITLILKQATSCVLLVGPQLLQKTSVYISRVTPSNSPCWCTYIYRWIIRKWIFPIPFLPLWMKFAFTHSNFTNVNTIKTRNMIFHPKSNFLTQIQVKSTLKSNIRAAYHTWCCDQKSVYQQEISQGSLL